MSVRSVEREAITSEEEKATAVRNMFGAIAPRYDLLNHLLSLNIDKRWRRRAIDQLLEGSPPEVDRSDRGGTSLSVVSDSGLAGRYLDACAGTLDLALELARRPGFTGKVIASDFTLAMLEQGEAKIDGHPVTSICADALELPFADSTFDGVTVGFGVRNLADLEGGLAEFARILRPGGRLVILEFSTPGWQPFRSLYLFYFLRVLPLVGRLISRHSRAYTYLPASVLEFPEPSELADMIRDAGFGELQWTSLSGGIAAVHSGVRLADD